MPRLPHKEPNTMIRTILGTLSIQTGQEFAGESHRTSVFDMATGNHLLNVHQSDAAYTAEDADAQHARYVALYAGGLEHEEDPTGNCPLCGHDCHCPDWDDDLARSENNRAHYPGYIHEFDDVPF